MRRAALFVVLAGCGVHTSHIGPYVTNVERRGADLAVVVCDVILDNGTLSMGQCFEQKVPLRGLALAPGATPAASTVRDPADPRGDNDEPPANPPPRR